jgi:hypothetical protein
VEAIVFGSIGVLAHASEIQWNTFNQALMEMGQKGELVTLSGEKNHQKSYLGEGAIHSIPYLHWRCEKVESVFQRGRLW